MKRAPTTIANVAAELSARARAAERLVEETPRLRALRERYGWDVAIAHMLRLFGGVTTAEVAAVFGVAVETADMALRRTGFAENERERWTLVENRALTDALADYERDREERARAQRHRERVEPWRRANGHIVTVRFGEAMQALFEDGRERSTMEVTYVLRGDDATRADAFVVRRSLSNCPDVEPVGEDRWRRAPTRSELRGRVAELEAEIERLRKTQR